MSAALRTYFQDVVQVTQVDKDGKKFDRVSRLEAATTTGEQ